MKNLLACRGFCGLSMLAGLWTGWALAQVDTDPRARGATSSVTRAQQAVLDRVNHYRRLAGVPAVAADPRLVQAAQAHSQYMSESGAITHVQTLDDPGFTGETVDDRLRAVGYPFRRASEVVGVASSVNPHTLVDNLMSAIYHRFLILDPAVTHAGPGVAAARNGKRKRVYVTVAFASTERPGTFDEVLTVYPAADQAGVATDFDPTTEVPNPMPGHDLVGEPVSVQIDADAQLEVKTFRLYRLGEDNEPHPLQAQLLTQARDSNTPEWAAALIPIAPLAPATRYRAEFAGLAAGEPVARTWTFTTAAEQPVTMHFARAVVSAGGRQTVRLRNLDASRGAFHVCYGPADLVREAVQETNDRLALTVGRCEADGVCEVTVTLAYEAGCEQPVAEGTFEVRS